MGKVFYADLWGLRKGKYRSLLENDISTTEWQELEPVAPYFFFVPKAFDLQKEYEKGWIVTDIFPVNATGFTTHRDRFVIDSDEQFLRERIAVLRDSLFSNDQIKERFNLKDTDSWSLDRARKELQSDEEWEAHFICCLYRPFDVRPIFYGKYLLDRPRLKVMRHMLGRNVALLAMRQVVLGSPEYTHFGVSNLIVDNRSFLSNRGRPSIFPLYLYTTPEETACKLFPAKEVARKPNLSPKFIAAVEEKLGLEFVPDGKGDLEACAEPAEATTFGPEGILHYAYAVFHSPTYRERYAEFLKIAFPRLPLTSDRELFKALAERGEELVALHLMESPKLSQLITSFPVPGSNEVERVRYTEPTGRTEPSAATSGDVGADRCVGPGRVYINKTQYFEGIEPEVWEFQVGGYQVLQKWLKDRKRAGRKLSFDDLFHYQKIVVALKETMRLMGERLII